MIVAGVKRSRALETFDSEPIRVLAGSATKISVAGLTMSSGSAERQPNDFKVECVSRVQCNGDADEIVSIVSPG